MLLFLFSTHLLFPSTDGIFSIAGYSIFDYIHTFSFVFIFLTPTMIHETAIRQPPLPNYDSGRSCGWREKARSPDRS